ncbi:sulfite exporter TauE/SafE family protein [bacterium]|nr:sulfite exporter TauE/SafE family protein [bacterium]
MSHSIYFVVPVVVFGVAFLFSMLGLGGGQLYVPIFYWLGMDLKAEAIPLSLLLNFVTQLSAVTTYLRHKLVEVVAGMPLIATMLVFPFVGAYFTRWISARTIILIFAVLLIAVAVQTISGWRPGSGIFTPRQKVIIGLVAGSFIGFIVGLLGRGGGSFVVPTLLLIGFAPKRAAATSSFVVTFSALSGFLGHVSTGHINWWLALIGASAAVLGSQLGSRLMARKMKGRTLKIIFAVVLILIGIQLIVKQLL